jgi:acyl-CoA thioester hydrolase
MAVPLESPFAETGAAAGVIRDGVHIWPVRVYFEDTDVGGVVYYANYLRFAERARTEMLRCLGVPHSEMMARDGLVFAVRRCEVDYFRPARLDDALEVRTRPVEIGAASLWLDQQVMRDGDELARLRVCLACITDSGRPARLPPRLRSALRPRAVAPDLAASSKDRN